MAKNKESIKTKVTDKVIKANEILDTKSNKLERANLITKSLDDLEKDLSKPIVVAHIPGPNKDGSGLTKSQANAISSQFRDIKKQVQLTDKRLELYSTYNLVMDEVNRDRTSKVDSALESLTEAVTSSSTDTSSDKEDDSGIGGFVKEVASSALGSGVSIVVKEAIPGLLTKLGAVAGKLAIGAGVGAAAVAATALVASIAYNIYNDIEEQKEENQEFMKDMQDKLLTDNPEENLILKGMSGLNDELFDRLTGDPNGTGVTALEHSINLSSIKDVYGSIDNLKSLYSNYESKLGESEKYLSNINFNPSTILIGGGSEIANIYNDFATGKSDDPIGAIALLCSKLGGYIISNLHISEDKYSDWCYLIREEFLKILGMRNTAILVDINESIPTKDKMGMEIYPNFSNFVDMLNDAASSKKYKAVDILKLYYESKSPSKINFDISSKLTNYSEINDKYKYYVFNDSLCKEGNLYSYLNSLVWIRVGSENTTVTASYQITVKAAEESQESINLAHSEKGKASVLASIEASRITGIEDLDTEFSNRSEELVPKTYIELLELLKSDNYTIDDINELMNSFDYDGSGSGHGLRKYLNGMYDRKGGIPSHFKSVLDKVENLGWMLDGDKEGGVLYQDLKNLKLYKMLNSKNFDDKDKAIYSALQQLGGDTLSKILGDTSLSDFSGDIKVNRNLSIDEFINNYDSITNDNGGQEAYNLFADKDLVFSSDGTLTTGSGVNTKDAGKNEVLDAIIKVINDYKSTDKVSEPELKILNEIMSKVNDLDDGSSLEEMQKYISELISKSDIQNQLAFDALVESINKLNTNIYYYGSSFTSTVNNPNDLNN